MIFLHHYAQLVEQLAFEQQEACCLFEKLLTLTVMVIRFILFVAALFSCFFAACAFCIPLQ